MAKRRSNTLPAESNLVPYANTTSPTHSTIIASSPRAHQQPAINYKNIQVLQASTTEGIESSLTQATQRIFFSHEVTASSPAIDTCLPPQKRLASLHRKKRYKRS
ncbi:hypothetical protein GWK47_038787 [Chionoecetes opilio]|uniref:Uncharacterized protein n=1 Tax=Chionoecetes opilio TaxID=41210 RepID=A0A8J4YKN2_CHIOP|nr:hypothetical protein GWK47_038787 [Chionoecetes opilio]